MWELASQAKSENATLLYDNITIGYGCIDNSPGLNGVILKTGESLGVFGEANADVTHRVKERSIFISIRMACALAQ